jgi:threonine/homoserine/homoserine lactone efflux protein
LSPAAPSTLALAAYGFLLGWSVAWPPGPINAEMVRRGLAQGFGPAFALGLGACTGDALWAAIVVLGAGVLLAAPAMHAVLGALSTLLLLLLAGVFLSGAWRAFGAARADAPPDAATGRFEGARGGFALGFGMALTSPWNVAFWLAVIGRPDTTQQGLKASLVVAGAVILGAALWCLLLCAAVVALRLRFASALWDVLAKAASGLLMLYFAIDGALRLSGG